MTGRVSAYRNWLGLSAWCLVACNTYDSSLLVSLDPSLPGGAGSGPTSGAAGILAQAGATSAAGASGELSTGGANAGASGGEPSAGNGGSAGSVSEGGSPGAGGMDTSGGGGSTGGAGGSAGVSGGSAGSGGFAGAPPYESIDDFEDLNSVVDLSHQRNGPWYVFSDGTAGTKSPLTVALLGAANARDGSTAALHFTASGFTSWGAGVGADLVNTAAVKVAYDVSAYKGIRFYAKVATASQKSLKVLIPTTYSDLLGGKCVAAAGTSQCGDHLFCAVTTLKTTWDVYQCNFVDLKQAGFGLHQTALDPASVYSIQFTFATPPALPVDLWIDDVSFVLK